MPIEGVNKAKSLSSKRPAAAINRRTWSGREQETAASGIVDRMDLEGEGPLPPALRTRLYDLFSQIEREFENLYVENLALQEKIDLLNERLEAVGEKADTVESLDGANTFKQTFKKSGRDLSQRIKLTYKTSTSKIVSSFRTASSGCQQLRDYRGHRDGVWEVNVSKFDPKIIGTSSVDRTARIWWIESGSCLLQYLGHSGSVNSIRFHPGSQDLVVTASGDQTAHIWKATVNVPSYLETTKAQSSGEEEYESSEKEDADGVDSSEDKQEPLYVRQPQLSLHGHNSVVIAADWLPQGSQIITASWDRTAILFDAEKGEIINQLTGHDQELSNVCAHATQRLVVTSSKDTTFRLWDMRDPALKVNVFQGHQQQVTSAVFAGGDRVVSGSDDRTVKVWDLKNMRSPITTIRTDSAVNRLAVSPISNIISIPHDNRHIRLHDLTGARVTRLPRSNRQGHSRMVCATAWSEDANTCNLFSCGFDRHVFRWNVNLGVKE